MGEQVLRAEVELKPHGVWSELPERQIRKTARPALADEVLHARVGAVAGLEGGEV